MHAAHEEEFADLLKDKAGINQKKSEEWSGFRTHT